MGIRAFGLKPLETRAPARMVRKALDAPCP